MEKEDLVSKYQKKIQEELYGDAASPDANYSYSYAYRVFKQEQASRGHLLYEKLCRASEKILPIKAAQQDIEKVSLPIKLAHLDITPGSVYSFSYLMAVLSIVVFAVLTAVTFNLLIIVIGLLIGVSLLFYLPTIPKTILIQRKGKR